MPNRESTHKTRITTTTIFNRVLIFGAMGTYLLTAHIITPIAAMMIITEIKLISLAPFYLLSHIHNRLPRLLAWYLLWLLWHILLGHCHPLPGILHQLGDAVLFILLIKSELAPAGQFGQVT